MCSPSWTLWAENIRKFEEMQISKRSHPFFLAHLPCTQSVSQFSCSVMSDSLPPHESQHARPPCPSPTPGVHSESRPLSQWCHPAISSSVVPYSSCLQSLPASEPFPMSQLFAWGGQSTGVSAQSRISGSSWLITSLWLSGSLRSFLYMTFCDLMDCTLPGSSVHGILQARKLEWVAILFSRRSSWRRDWTQVSCIAGGLFNVWVTGEAQLDFIVI